MKSLWNQTIKFFNTPIKSYGINGKEIVDNSPRLSILKGVIMILCGGFFITILIFLFLDFFQITQPNTTQSESSQEVEANNFSATDTTADLKRPNHESTTSISKTQSSENWVTYSDDVFKVSFPENPQITRVPGDFPSVTYRGGQKDSTQYFLSSTKFPDDYDISDPLGILKNAVLSSVNNLNGNLIGAIDTKNLTGHDSIDFVIEISDGPRTYMGRNLLIENTLYEMRVVYMNDNEQNAEYRNFVDSFILQ